MQHPSHSVYTTTVESTHYERGCIYPTHDIPLSYHSIWATLSEIHMIWERKYIYHIHKISSHSIREGVISSFWCQISELLCNSCITELYITSIILWIIQLRNTSGYLINLCKEKKNVPLEKLNISPKSLNSLNLPGWELQLQSLKAVRSTA